MLPTHDAPDGAFSTVRALLSAAEFTADGICRRLDIPDVFSLRLGEPRRGPATVPVTAEADLLDMLLALFIEGRAIDADTVQHTVGGEPLQAFRALGLIEGTGTLRATVHLYPVHELWLVSDLVAPEPIPDDAVYPAITSSVRVFLSALPDVAGRRVLELCSGTGVAALLAAKRGAREAVAVDITARASHFAAFNARLNAVPLTVRQGDLYAPVAEERFDVIVAHPPYVPAMTTRAIFRDGGADGESITRAVLRGAAAHLEADGVLCCTSMLSDRRSGSALERLEALLADAAPRTDLVILHVADLAPESPFLPQLFRATPADLPEVVAGWRAYRELDITALRLCTTILRRHAGTRASHRVTVSCDPRTGWQEVEWLLAARELPRLTEMNPSRWLSARPRLNRTARFQQRYAYVPDADPCFQPVEGALAIGYPSVLELAMEGDDVALLGALDGRRTFRELWREHQEAGSLPPGQTAEAFLGSLLPLLVNGVLETDQLPFPDRVP